VNRTGIDASKAGEEIDSPVPSGGSPPMVQPALAAATVEGIEASNARRRIPTVRSRA
jgi:hypothetical protein